MRPLKTFILLITATCFLPAANAQREWVSYTRTIDVKAYQGLNFRLSSLVRTEIADDTAAAQLWVRVDKTTGRGFFYNMWDKPIRAKDWRPYTIEGRIDTGAYRIAFGTICRYNGKFYFDDMKIEVETAKNKWETIFADDFENSDAPVAQGTQRWRLDTIKGFSGAVVEAGSRGKVFLIEGKGIPKWGFDDQAGKFADVNGIKLYYEIYGEGAPLLVLHGNGGSIKSAAGFYPDLVKQYKVIAIDSRAQGRSTFTNEPLNYDMMASDVNALLEQLHIDSVFIWGQSDGAILALLLAKDYPRKVKRALAYAPNIQPDSLAIFPWGIRAMRKEVAENKDPKQRALNQMMLDFPNFPYTELSKIKAPIMIMSGDRDVIRPEHILKMYQHIPNAQLCILPGATHGGAWEKKELFLGLMNDFFLKPFRMPDTKSWFER